jgi:small subunit ribosomal protein S25e
MGGSKNKSPAQKERAQKRDTGQKTKSEKGDKTTKVRIAVTINESEAIKWINSAKMITAHELSRETNTKISTAKSFLQKLVKDGMIKKVAGFSGHYIYHKVSE